jgi:hypothetical protein
LAIESSQKQISSSALTESVTGSSDITFFAWLDVRQWMLGLGANEPVSYGRHSGYGAPE